MDTPDTSAEPTTFQAVRGLSLIALGLYLVVALFADWPPFSPKHLIGKVFTLQNDPDCYHDRVRILSYQGQIASVQDVKPPHLRYLMRRSNFDSVVFGNYKEDTHNCAAKFGLPPMTAPSN